MRKSFDEFVRNFHCKWVHKCICVNDYPAAAVVHKCVPWCFSNNSFRFCLTTIYTNAIVNSLASADICSFSLEYVQGYAFISKCSIHSFYGWPLLCVGRVGVPQPVGHVPCPTHIEYA